MPRAWYNEIDPYAAQWLRNLISKGLIPDGDVDTRSIVDVAPADLRDYAQCHFFAGLGGWPAALRRSGVWPDHRPVWTGSCPCQPFSLAGKQGGFDDPRHLWPQWRYLIAQCRPAIVLGEQVASASEWLRLVRSDLEALDYAVGAIPIEAASAGAYHLRDRFWFVANSQGNGERRARESESSSESQIKTGGLRSIGSDQSGFVGDTAGVAERKLDREGDTFSTGWQARPISGGTGDHFEWAIGVDSGIDRDNSEMGVADADECGRLPRDGTAASSRYRHPIVADGDGFEWVTGSDGKARRVKSGIRLLAYGVSARVAKLRALGNAIDLRPATAFIHAVNESLNR
jgi:DNA (cytosine-5)-methyltransferase 1